MQQVKLMGLDQVRPEAVDQVRTVVVRGNYEEYIAALKQIAGHRI